MELQQITQEEFNKVYANHQEWSRNGLSKLRMDLSNKDLSNIKFPDKINLIGAILEGANLSKVNLEGADLRGANLIEANLSEGNFVEAKLDGANLMGQI